jgi:hypothetical protein
VHITPVLPPLHDYGAAALALYRGVVGRRVDTAHDSCRACRDAQVASNHEPSAPKHSPFLQFFDTSQYLPHALHEPWVYEGFGNFS